MTIGIMQPYFFPYIGYFQLIHAVDEFVLYDDVQFMKQGWINRNRIQINGKEQFINVPLSNISSNKLINETYINHKQINIWLRKTSKTIRQNYNKTTHLEVGLDLLKDIDNYIEDFKTVDELNKFTIEKVMSYLEITTPIFVSSNLFQNNNLKGQDRVLDICKIASANRYINASGGRELYSKETFMDKGINLGFLECQVDEPSFYFSILHTIMLEDKEYIKDQLNSYSIV